jgi:hypothetical protein
VRLLGGVAVGNKARALKLFLHVGIGYGVAGSGEGTRRVQLHRLLRRLGIDQH